uniref:Teneurin N-terminal domain-containing protein n=1 Tax=Eptatretus burgeri TaxID=7764 RepID=A0A8C4QEI5_EPTBU
MEVKDTHTFSSLGGSHRGKQLHYLSSSVEICGTMALPHKSYSSSETLKAFDHESHLLYERTEQEIIAINPNLLLHIIIKLRFTVALPITLISSFSPQIVCDSNCHILSIDHMMQLWEHEAMSDGNSCVSSRANSALTLTDTEHENTKSDSETGRDSWENSGLSLSPVLCSVAFMLCRLVHPARML